VFSQTWVRTCAHPIEFVQFCPKAQQDGGTPHPAELLKASRTNEEDREFFARSNLRPPADETDDAMFLTAEAEGRSNPFTRKANDQ
jgi:hypothetical protein